MKHTHTVQAHEVKTQMNDYDAMNILLLVTALNLSLFSIAELNPQKMGQVNKSRYMNLRAQLKNFLTVMQANSTPELRQKLEDNTFESVGSIAELVAMVTQIHPNQQEWYLEECKKLVYVSVNRQNGVL